MSRDYIDLAESGKYKEAIEKILDIIANNNYDIVDIYNLSVAYIKTDDYKEAFKFICYCFTRNYYKASCIMNLLCIISRQPQFDNQVQIFQIFQGLFGIEFSKHYEDQITSYKEICDIFKYNKAVLGISKDKCLKYVSLTEEFIKNKSCECQSYINEITKKISTKNNGKKQLSIHKIKELKVIEMRDDYIIVYKYALFGEKLCAFIDKNGELTDRYVFEKTRNSRYFQQKLIKKYPEAKIIKIK